MFGIEKTVFLGMTFEILWEKMVHLAVLVDFNAFFCCSIVNKAVLKYKQNCIFQGNRLSSLIS